MHHRSVVVSALVLLLAVPVRAAQPVDESPAARVPEILVSATRIESTLATSPDAITVVSREEIEQLQARTVADVLETVPGVIVSHTGQPGAQTSVFMRGANSGHTLVLVDGVRVNSAFNGRYDFVDLTVDNVERIEVVRGPQSTRYGSDALGGVINIVTKRGAPEPTGAALLELGSNASLRARGSAAASVGTLGVSAEISHFDTDNERPNGQYTVTGGSFGATWQALDRLAVGLTGSHRTSEAGAPNDRFTNDPNDLTRNENTQVTLDLHAVPAPRWVSRLSLSKGRERTRFDGPEPNPPYFMGALKTETISDNEQVDLQNVFTLAPGHRLFLGLSQDRTPTEFTSESAFGPASLDRSVTARAVSGQYDLSPAKSLTFSLGGRLDDFSTFGTHTTGRAGARYTVQGVGTILRANVGTGFHAPSISDLFYPGFSNPDLQAEKSTGWDLGLEQPLFGGRLQVGASWFHNDFDNLIAFSTTSFRPENIAEARTAGLETFLQWAPLAGLTVNGTYTWLSVAEDRTTGKRLLRRAEHTGSVAVHYRFTPWGQFDTAARFAGSSADKNFTTVPAADVTNDGFVKWDAGVTVTLWQHVNLVARVENLLDSAYEEAYGFPALGRTFWGGASVKF
ncbi:MAG: TonB-dependent receptor plug domain-containing protein [Candidatus Methylomirabilia bacterium]